MSKSKRRRARGDAPERNTPSPISASLGTNRVLAIGLAVYLAILATMVAFDSYAFLLKSTIVPFLLLVAVLSRRFGGFVNDWAVFLGAVVLFDSLRTVIFAVITHFELPMYAVYAIDWERWLCGGAVAPVSTQQWRATLADPHWLDRFFVLLHASHFLFFLLFGFVLWYVRREMFRTYAAAMLVVLYVALLVHLLVPTVPPWLASRDFALLPETVRLIQSVYNVNVPSLQDMFDVNPIAAMPSLHTAMPVLCAFVAVHYLGWAGLIVAAYAAGVAVAVIYLGEHYAVDVVGGILLSLVVYAGVRRWGAPSASVGSDAGISEPLAVKPIIAGIMLVGIAFGFGQVAARWLGPLPITTAFIERELVGRSPVANYLMGRVALANGDVARAHLQLTRALDDLPHPEHQKVIRSLLAQSSNAVNPDAAVNGTVSPAFPSDAPGR